MTKTALFVALSLVVGMGAGAVAYHIYDVTQYPVLSETCDKVDGRCYPYARYRDWASCQKDNDLGNMLCDRTVPGKVTCTTNLNPVGVGQCVNR